LPPFKVVKFGRKFKKNSIIRSYAAANTSVENNHVFLFVMGHVPESGGIAVIGGAMVNGVCRFMYHDK